MKIRTFGRTWDSPTRTARKFSPPESKLFLPVLKAGVKRRKQADIQLIYLILYNLSINPYKQFHDTLLPDLVERH